MLSEVEYNRFIYICLETLYLIADVIYNIILTIALNNNQTIM